MELQFLKNLVSPKPKGKKAPGYQLPPRDDLTLWYCFPSGTNYKGWEQEALPIGSGELGAKIFGGVATEELQLNEKTLWSGSTLGVDGCDNGNSKGDAGKSIAEIQALLADGNYDAATKKMEQLQGGEIGLGAYQNFGSLFCSISGSDEAEGYIRDLDLKTAVASVEYKQNGSNCRREYFASYPGKVICGRLQGQGLSARFSLKGAHPGCEQTEAKGNMLCLTGALQGKENPLHYAGVVRFETDGEMTAEKDEIQITHATHIDFFCSMKTDYGFVYPAYRQEINVLDWCMSKTESAAANGYEAVRAEHIRDYQGLFGRAEIDLGQETPSIPTDLLLYQYRKGKPSKALERLLFQFGRYLLIASSRPDGLPANLQGVWNASNEPQWQSDYHLNINLQMNYFHALNTNLRETVEPLFDFINQCLVVPGRASAASWTGIGDGDVAKPTGWMAHTQNNLQGHTGPGSMWTWGWDPAAGAFILENTYEYFLFTKDIQMLAKQIYPAMEEHALLWSQMLIEDKKYDRLVSSPCFSPEHGPVSIGNTYDQEMIWQLFANVIEAAQALTEAGMGEQVNQELLPLLKEQITKLKPHHVGKWGQLKEWIEEDEWPRRYTHGEQRNHRHISHLLGLYPGNHITPDMTDIIKAAKVSLNDRGDHGQGWSKALKIGSWARLGDGNHAYKILNGLLQYNINWNLWDIHPPYQIDGNFGYTAGVAEMLLQSHGNCVELLPALPSFWAKKGSFRGLMARGNFEVSCCWENGQVTKAELISHKGGHVKVQINGTVKELHTEKGGHYAL